MKIEFKKKSDYLKLFSDLKPGDVFLNEGDLYMVVVDTTKEDFDAVYLETGELAEFFKGDEEVIVVEATLVIPKFEDCGKGILQVNNVS